MSEKFVFHGQTTFIDQPKDSVIQNFQNTYIAGDNADTDQVNKEIKRLLELILNSQDLPKEEKEETVQALHTIAEQIKEQKGSKLGIKGNAKSSSRNRNLSHRYCCSCDRHHFDCVEIVRVKFTCKNAPNLKSFDIYFPKPKQKTLQMSGSGLQVPPRGLEPLFWP